MTMYHKQKVCWGRCLPFRQREGIAGGELYRFRTRYGAELGALSLHIFYLQIFSVGSGGEARRYCAIDGGCRRRHYRKYGVHVFRQHRLSCGCL